MKRFIEPYFMLISTLLFCRWNIRLHEQKRKIDDESTNLNIKKQLTYLCFCSHHCHRSCFADSFFVRRAYQIWTWAEKNDEKKIKFNLFKMAILSDAMECNSFMCCFFLSVLGAILRHLSRETKLIHFTWNRWVKIMNEKWRHVSFCGAQFSWCHWKFFEKSIVKWLVTPTRINPI